MVVSRRPWSLDELGRMLASINYCIAAGQSIDDEVPRLMLAKGYNRTFNARESRLRNLNKSYNVVNVSHSSKPIRASGTQDLQLPDELSRAVETNRREISQGNNEPETSERSTLTSNLSQSPTVDRRRSTSLAPLIKKRPHEEDAADSAQRKRSRTNSVANATDAPTSDNNGLEPEQEANDDALDATPQEVTGETPDTMPTVPSTDVPMEIFATAVPSENTALGTSSAEKMRRVNKSLDKSRSSPPSPPSPLVQDPIAPTEAVPPSQNTSAEPANRETESLEHPRNSNHVTPVTQNEQPIEIAAKLTEMERQNEELSKRLQESEHDAQEMKARLTKVNELRKNEGSAYAQKISFLEAKLQSLENFKHRYEHPRLMPGETLDEWNHENMLAMERRLNQFQAQRSKLEARGFLPTDFGDWGTLYPPQFAEYNLRWRYTWENLIIGFLPTSKTSNQTGDIETFVQAVVPENGIPPKFKPLLRRVCGIPPTESDENITLSLCFSKVSGTPANYILIAALFVAEMFRITYEVNHHTSGEYSEKLHQLWQSIAEFKGLQYLRGTDTFCTVLRMKDKHFSEIEVPEIATNLSTACFDTFDRYLPRGKELDERWEDTEDGFFVNFLRMRNDLYMGKDRFKIAFIPPGAPFHPRIMDPVDEGGNGFITPISKKDYAKYRVKICMFPALIMVAENLSEEPGFESRENYKDALLDSWDWYMEPDKYDIFEWPLGSNGRRTAGIASKGVVVVERIPPEEMVAQEQGEATAVPEASGHRQDAAKPREEAGGPSGTQGSVDNVGGAYQSERKKLILKLPVTRKATLPKEGDQSGPKNAGNNSRLQTASIPPDTHVNRQVPDPPAPKKKKQASNKATAGASRVSKPRGRGGRKGKSRATSQTEAKNMPAGNSRRARKYIVRQRAGMPSQGLQGNHYVSTSDFGNVRDDSQMMFDTRWHSLPNYNTSHGINEHTDYPQDMDIDYPHDMDIDYPRDMDNEEDEML